jgi:hypothetical protein
MAMKWSDVAANPAFQALSFDEQEEARNQYFNEVVAPQVSKDEVDAVRSEFLADTRSTLAPPPDTGDETARLAARYKAPEKPGLIARISSALPKPVDPLGIGSGRPLGAPRAQEPAKPPKAPTPYRDRREALDDAVNLLEEGADQKAVTEAFSKGGIKFEEIVAHGKKRGSEYFDQQPGMEVADPEVTRLASRYPAPVTGEIKSTRPETPLPGADVLLAGAKGVVGGFKMLMSAGGAGGRPTSTAEKALETADSYLEGLRSAAAVKDDEEIGRIMDQAKDGTWTEQVVAAAKAAGVAPASLVAQGLGTSVPVILASLLPGVRESTVARLTAQIGLGAAQGAGATKESIYTAVKDDMLRAGVSKIEAEERAEAAQSYLGQNKDQIAIGMALGALASSTGVEKVIPIGQVSKVLAKSGVSRAVASAEQNVIGRGLIGGLTEAVPEFAQGSAEQVAQNVALQREGRDVPTFQGAVGQGTLEAIAGFGAGAVTNAAFGRPQTAADQLARELDVSIANTDFTSADPVARARLDPGTTDPSLISPAQTARGVADVGPSAPISFTPVGAPTQQAGLVDIVVPTAPETTDVSTLGATGGQLDLRSPAGSDQLGGGLGLPGLDAAGTGQLRGGDAGLPAADAGANVLAGSPAGQPTPGIALPRVAARATDQDLLARTEAAIAAPENNNAVVEPTEQWFGRKGDGYATEVDAGQALAGRKRMFPTLDWKVEEMPSGKYRLAGYEQQNSQPAPTVGTTEAGAGTPQPMQVAPITAAAPAAAAPITAPSGKPFSTQQTAAVFAQQNGITGYSTVKMGGGWVIKPTETTLGTQTPQAIQGQTQGQAPAIGGAASQGLAGGLQPGDAAQAIVPEIAGAAAPGVADNARQLASAQPELGQPLAAGASEGERAAVVGGPLFASKVKSAPISVIKLAQDYTTRQSGVEFAPVSSNNLSEQQRAASLMATLNGQTVTFIEQTAGDARAMPNGLAIGGKHVMIDVKSEDAPLAVAMHEVVHNMPDNIRKPLEGALRNLFKSGMEGDFKREFNYDDADLDKEIPAMITQAVTKRKDFWNELRQEMGNKDFSAVAELIITRLDNWVRGVRKEYGDGFISKYVTDVEQARSLISKAYAQSMRDQGLQPNEAVAGDVMASQRSRVDMNFKDVIKRTPELQAAAEKVKAGEMTAAEYDALVNETKPVEPYKSVPAPATVSDITSSLKSDQLERIGKARELKAGYPVGLRLDIPAYSNHGTWVVSVHEQEAGYNAGKSIGYEPVAAATNVSFGVVEKAALNIAGGKPKATIAVMKGSWKPTTAKQAYTAAQAALKSQDWVQVGMDPERHSYFYDRKTMEPVISADEVLQIGPLVLAKKPVFGDKADFMFSRRVSAPDNDVAPETDGNTEDNSFENNNADVMPPEQIRADGIQFSLRRVEEINDAPEITMQDLVDETVFPILADLTAAGYVYMGKELRGGPYYTLLPSNSKAGLIWANDGKGVASIKNKKAARGVIGLVIAMKQDSHATNNTVANIIFRAVEDEIQKGSVAKEDIPKLDELVRGLANRTVTKNRKVNGEKVKETKQIFPKFADFPGFSDREASEKFLRSMPFEARGLFFQEMTKPTVEDLGLGVVRKVINDTVEPDLRGLNMGDVVMAIRFDPNADTIELGEKTGTPEHDSYRYGVKGTVIGKFKRPISFQNVFVDLMEQRRAAGTDRPAGNYRSLTLKKPEQKITQEIADSVSQEAYKTFKSPAEAKAAVASAAGEWNLIERPTGAGVKEFLRTSRIYGEGKVPSFVEAKKLIKDGDLKIFRLGETENWFAIEKRGKKNVMTSIMVAQPGVRRETLFADMVFQAKANNATHIEINGTQAPILDQEPMRPVAPIVAELSEMKDADLINLGIDPKEINRLNGLIEEDGAEQFSPTSLVMYSNRAQSPADRIKWRKVSDVKTEIGLDSLPRHIIPFATFMRTMADKAANGGLTSRDLIKAYTIARSSMNRTAVTTSRIKDAGLVLPENYVEDKIRPEGAFGYWLLSPVGQRYLNAAEVAIVDQDAVADAVKVMAPFGTQNALGKDLERAAGGDLHNRLPAMTAAIAKAATGKNAVKDWQDATNNLFGVREAKKGFLGSLLGFGQLPTFDARQINVNVKPDSKEDTLRALSSVKARDVVAKLARRMDALSLTMDPEYAPFYQHLAHHAVWDAVGGTETTHSDVIESMIMASNRAKPTFYSQLERVIANVPAKLATQPAAQWALWLDSNGPKQGVKKDEMEWSGIKDYLTLRGKDKVTSAELQAYLKSSGVRVTETMRGEVDQDETFAQMSRDMFDAEYYDLSPNQSRELQQAHDRMLTQSNTAYERYSLPGGENYRELLLTLPLVYQKYEPYFLTTENGGAMRSGGSWTVIYAGKPDGSRIGRYATRAEAEAAAERETRMAADPDQQILDRSSPIYKSSHWDDPNVLAHIRINDRTDADGKRVLFVEEVQSDWGQDGLKKGFSNTKLNMLNPVVVFNARTGENVARFRTGAAAEAYIAEQDPAMATLDYEDTNARGGIEKGMVPAAPFVTKTEGWLNLALKRIAMLAVEEGYDKVAFVNGQQSADRYDLSKQISSISYEPGSKPENEGLLQAWDLDRKMVMSEMVTTDRIEDYVGKEVAVRLLETEKVMGKHLLDGENVKVGGKGMIKFYDEIVPQAITKLLPKLGGEKLGRTEIDIQGSYGSGSGAYIKYEYQGPTLTTAEIREAARNDDLPAAIQRQLDDIRIHVQSGLPLAEAVVGYGSFSAAKALGGELVPAANVMSTQPGFDVTDKMRETVGAGLPMFSKRVAAPETDDAEPDVEDVSRSNRRQKLSTIGQNFTLPGTSKFDAGRIKLQDDALRMKRVIEAVEKKTGNKVGEAQNFYDANTLMPGRVQATMDDFRDNVMRPLIDKAVDFGIDLDELALYAYAKHAEERNAYIASINKRFPDGGSGMTDAHAKSILQLAKVSGDEAKFEELHRDLMAITSTTRQVMLAEGLISQDEFNALDGAYENYIPLRGLENVDENTGAIRPGIGRGINVRGGETIKALGRKSQASDLIENVIRDYQRVIMRVEKNDVGKVLLDFVLSNPDPDLWGVDVERSKPALNKATGLVQYTKAVEKGEDTIGVKVGGEQVYIKLADPELARAIRQAWKDETSGLERATLAVSGWWNNWLRNVLTRYNPAFAAINIPRDALWSGTSAALAELGPKGLARYLANYGKALMASTRQEAGLSGTANKIIGNQQMDQVFQEFRNAGAITGGFYMRSLDDINKDLRNEMLLAGAKAKNTFEAIKSLPPYKMATLTARMLEFMGSASENATRFALYQAAREVGRTPAQAALLAKDGTTNFNRKGEWGGALNNLYLFFNAAVQGNAQLFKVLKSPAVQASMAGVAGVGVMLAMYGASSGGEDDDGEAYWDKVPSYVKERNLVFMLPPGDALADGIERVGKRGRYFTLPVQYGFNIFPNAGYMMADVFRNAQDPKRGVTPTKAALHMTSTVFGSINPFGGAVDFGDGVQVLLAAMPTLVDLPVQLINERGTFGSPSAPEKSSFDVRPDSSRMFTSQMNTVPEKIAKALNELGGGNEAKAGKILGVETSVTPGTIQTLISATTGGLGSFVEQVGSSVIAMTGDEKDVKAAKIPFLNKFYGEVDESVNIRGAGDRMREIRKLADEVKAQQKIGLDPELDSDEERLLGLASMQESYQKFQTQLRKNEIAIIKDEKMTEAEKKLQRRQIQVERDRLATEVNREYLKSLK